MAGEKLRRICSLRAHDERVWYVCWRPGRSSPQLASCGSDRVVRIWGAKAGSELTNESDWTLLGEIDASERHGRTLRSLTWSPDGEILAVASFDASTSIWKEAPTENGSGGLSFECVSSLSGHENEVKSASFSPSGTLFATCSRDRSIWVYDAEDEQDEYECVALLQSHTQDVKMVKWHPSQDVLFSCSYDDTIKVWGPDGDDWCCKETLEGHDSTVWAISFDATGSRFVTCSDDRSLRIWTPDPMKGIGDKRSQGSQDEASGAKGDLGKTIASAAFVSPLFRGAQLVASTTSAEASDAQAEPATASRVPQDASCGWRCALEVKDEHPRPVYSVDWLPFASKQSSITIASGCGDNCIRIFQPKDKLLSSGMTCVAEVEGHDGDVNCVAWWSEQLPSGGALLASAGDDAEVNIWAFVG
eukprot:TRINITY_DN24608_c1_g1_i1.p1 TRINITY_DN24608_c1_g1~~TRINITY_DN24608_c1_g1_i1.p1  ORF type:complete len:417 (-),score=75.45 TRINITY_DN24608_c1_g1_i1:202-1452(-)